ncbi:EamA family transporter [Halalkalibacter urbisdiaboli]|uniref:EamA family transporter n=1 Tax=Halalkalibacter urbisdiaboli TaxID=1960589 RepID=UPI000B43DEE0|nr:DMT family transporter [Halalkalibacter urbisdiaboli]
MKTSVYALLVFLGGCCFGVLSTFVKLAYAQGFSLTAISGSQFLFGALLLWLMVLFSKTTRLTLRSIVSIVLCGIPMGLTGIFYYQSLQTLDASLAIIFLFQFVWIGTLLEYVIERKKPTFKKLLSIFVLMIGSFLAAGIVNTDIENLSWIGVVLGLLASVSFSIFIYTSGSIGKNIPAIQKSAWLSVGGLLIVSIILPPTYLVNGELMNGLLPFGVFLGFFGVALPPLLFSIGMPHIGSGLGTILSAVELPVAVTMSSLILAETILYSQWLGVVIILSGIIVGNIRFSFSAFKEQKKAAS